MKRSPGIIVVGSLVVIFAAGFLWRPGGRSRPDSGAPAPQRPVNVLLITLDTTRADHIGAYGYAKARTPAIDALAAKGVRFAHAQSPVPLTLPAHASIMTGTYPTFHGLRNNGSYFLPPQAETLAETLKSRGYRTAAFVSSFILDSRFGLDQGFDVYSDRMDTAGGIKDMQSERPAGEVFADFDAWLTSDVAALPFFCWLHFYDPHLPYAPPEPFKSDPSLEPYDGEIANVDLNVGRVFDRLRARGVDNDTLIVVAGDHGEGFGEHGEFGHGIFCYQETLAVPLLMRIPGIRNQPAVIDDTVDLVDIMPTVLAAVGAPVPTNVQGITLLPLVISKRGREREFYFESFYAQEDMGGAPLTGILEAGWKYIDLPRAECYDTKNDPGEKVNLVSSEAATARRIKARLMEWREKSSRQNIDTVRTLSAEERRRLESLGYVAAVAPGPSAGTLPDPKDLIAGWTENLTGKAYFQAGELARAEAHFLRAIELNPAFFNPYVDLSRLRFGRDDTEGGLAILKEGVARIPGSAAVKIEYARGLADADRPEEALSVLREAEKQMVYGQHETMDVMFGVTLSRMERFKEAADYLRKALEIEPDNAAAARDLGYCLYRSGLPAEAVPFYKRAEAGLPDDPVVPGELALCQAALKDYAAAALSFERSVRLGPSQRTYFNYAVMIAESGDLAKAISLMNKSLEQTPQDPQLAGKAASLLESWKSRLNR
jgi:arylsulfatase A-like enzyme/thioredoxin-like negative regulator of GroEL